MMKADDVEWEVFCQSIWLIEPKLSNFSTVAQL